MRKKIVSVMLLFFICVSLGGCIRWETPVHYGLMHDLSEIKSIRIYCTDDDSEKLYNYSDPDDPCRVLLGEISSDQFAPFTEELIGLSRTESHLIFLFPVTYDPNFYYGNYLVKIEYHDGSCELISDLMQSQFKVDEKHPDVTRYAPDQEAWLAFLQNWVTLPDVNNK